jgi:tRNA (guanine37-N1)-methyltransferase
MNFKICFEVFTLFPEVFEPYLNASIIGRAHKKGLMTVNLHNIRDWTTDRHHVTDDEPYGGGGGMVMKPEPVFSAIEGVLGSPPSCPVILLTPQGNLFSQDIAKGIIASMLDTLEDIESPIRTPRLALLCGRYEGIDERVRRYLISDEISIGDYVLTGGEIAAMVLIDALTRLIPGVLGDPEGAEDDSFASGLLEYPHYTRPAEFRGWRVPDVLRSGDHARVNRWRREQALLRTWKRRPELLSNALLTKDDREFLLTLNAGKFEDEP